VEMLTFRPELGAESPLWDSRGHMVWLDSLPLPQPLQAHLAAWAAEASDLDDGLSREGRRLFQQLGHYLRSPLYGVRWDLPTDEA
jgi:hypothetical protein